MIQRIPVLTEIVRRQGYYPTGLRYSLSTGPYGDHTSVPHQQHPIHKHGLAHSMTESRDRWIYLCLSVSDDVARSASLDLFVGPRIATLVSG